MKTRPALAPAKTAQTSSPYKRTRPPLSEISLYIHIPFCHHICPYCAFVKTKWNQTAEDTLIQAICAEATAYHTQFGALPIKTIFMGGGTPNSLSERGLTTLLETIHTHFKIHPEAEKTSEMNPESVSHTGLKILKKFGFNRLSFGVQSFDKEELKFLGRVHTPNRLEKVIEMTQHHGFSNFNLDLIFGLPISTLQILESNLNKALTLNPTHISTYALTIEPQTPFKRSRKTTLPSDQAKIHYQFIRRYLSKHQFKQYEVSAFSKKGFQSQHNLTYWNLNSFIGLGPNAASFFQEKHYTNTKDIATYCQNAIPPLLQKKIRPLTKNDLLKDFLVANLRRPNGISHSILTKRFGENALTDISPRIELLKERGFLRKTPNRLQITSKGLYVLDSVLLEILN